MSACNCGDQQDRSSNACTCNGHPLPVCLTVLPPTPPTPPALARSWWSYAEFQKSNERLSVMQALEASMEAQQAALEERLAAVEAREAALEARLAALEEQQRGGSGS